MRKGVVGVLILFLCLALLAGCASGTATDARRGQRQDTAEEANLPAQQATFTAQEYFPPTPTPLPTRPPAPALASLVIALALGAGNEPVDEYAAVPTNAGTIYASARLDGLRAGQVVSASWTDANNTVVATSRFDIPAGADRDWVALPLALDGSLAPGDYAVYLFADDRPLNSLVFRLLPAGSAPQRLADLPPADQIQIRLAEPTPTPGGPATSWPPAAEDGQAPIVPNDPAQSQPVDPFQPVDPSQPVDPAQPADPGAPVDPGAPPTESP